jgi:hypothetical protein
VSGETESEVSGWTTDTLKDHLDNRINAIDRFLNIRIDSQADKVELALAASERAITKADIATEKRFDGVNEFRQSLSDQAALFVTREVVEALVATKDAELKQLEKELSAFRAAQSRMVGIAVGLSSAVALIGVLFSIVIRLATGH